MSTITSTANPRVKTLVRLQRKAELRRELGLFCVESSRELHRALDSGYTVTEFWHDSNTPPPALPADCEVIETSASVIGKIAYRQNPQGFVAVLGVRPMSLADFSPAHPAMILVASGLEKPGNVGAILRSADAAGADALFIDEPGFDLYNPNCIRASTGAVFGLPVICDSPANLADWLDANDVLPIAATPQALHAPSSLNLRVPLAFVVGSEDQGLGEFWRKRAGVSVAIPMRGKLVDSLNVSISAALLMYEAARQRTG